MCHPFTSKATTDRMCEINVSSVGCTTMLEDIQHAHIPQWQCQDLLDPNCEIMVEGPWGIIFMHELATTESWA